MVTYTNKFNLPEPVMLAIINDEYSRGESDISVTQLIDPPLKVALFEAFNDQIVKDISDEIYALMGKGVHYVLEKAGQDLPSCLTEQRAFVKDVEGWTISGAMDHAVFKEMNGDHWEMDDYKHTSGYAVKEGKPGERTRKDDWTLQLNFLRWLLYHGYQIEVSKLRIVAFIREWSVLKAAREPDFPQEQVMPIEIATIDLDIVTSMIIEKVKAHQYAQQTVDEWQNNGETPLPASLECTFEERWAKPDTYAVKKKGRKSCLPGSAGLRTEEDALNYIVEKCGGTYDHANDQVKIPKDHYVEHRRGESTRCEHYCDVKRFCPFYLARMKEIENAAAEQSDETS